MAWGKIAQRVTLLGGLSQSVGYTVQLYIVSGIWTWPETLSPNRNRIIQVALHNIRSELKRHECCRLHDYILALLFSE